MNDAFTQYLGLLTFQFALGDTTMLRLSCKTRRGGKNDRIRLGSEDFVLGESVPISSALV